MDAVTLFASCALTLAPSQNGPPCERSPDPIIDARSAPRVSSLIDRWEPVIAEAAQRFAIPHDWIRAVMRSESGGRTMLAGRPITSIAGAMGLMQLMPGTYADMRQRYGLGTDSYDPRDNVLAGAAYLRLMYEQYGYPNLFAAYHAGPTRFAGYLLRGQSLPDATLVYVGSIVPGVETTMARRQSVMQNASPGGVGRAENRRPSPPTQTLFFVLNQQSEAQPLPSSESEIPSNLPRASATSSAPSQGFESQNPPALASGLFIRLSRTNP